MGHPRRLTREEITPIHITRPRASVIGLTALFFLLSDRPVPAEDANPPDPEAQARFLLDEVAKAYADLPVYADHGRIISTTSERKPGDSARTFDDTTLELALARPNRFALRYETFPWTSDGKTLTVAFLPNKKYAVEGAPAKTL